VGWGGVGGVGVGGRPGRGEEGGFRPSYPEFQTLRGSRDFSSSSVFN
jgi:hypothetical protein